MHLILRICVLVALIQGGLACGRGRKKPHGNNNPTGPTACATVACLLGDNVQTAPFAGAGDSPQSTCDSLNCNFESSCCWDNAKPPADELEYVQGSGQPDATKMQNVFGTQNVPDGNYLITYSDKEGTPDQRAQFYSCPVSCVGSDITVTLKHWANGTTLRVCTEQDPGSGPDEQTCQPLPTTNGNSDAVTLTGSQGQNQRVVIEAKGFTAQSVAILDDIQVKCDPCAETSAPPVVVTSGPSVAPSTICQDIPCDFEQGMCKYTADGDADANFQEVSTLPFNQRLTGIVKDGHQNGFAAAYVKPGKEKKGKKSLMKATTNFDQNYGIRFLYHSDVDGQTIKGCCNDESNCPFNSDKAVKTKDYQTWQTGSFTCPAGSTAVVFVDDNTQGSNEGAAGIDNIEVVQPGADPATGPSACPAGSRRAAAAKKSHLH